MFVARYLEWQGKGQSRASILMTSAHLHKPLPQMDLRGIDFEPAKVGAQCGKRAILSARALDLSVEIALAAEGHSQRKHVCWRIGEWP